MADFDTDVLVHVGYAKTGSTWLQKRVFDSGRYGLRTLGSRHDFSRIVDPNPLWYDPNDYRNAVSESYRHILADGLMPVATLERFCGNPHSGGYDATIIAGRLKELFPRGKVLIVSREQHSMLVSIYKHYIREGGNAKVEDYLCPPAKGKIPLFDFRHYEYDRLVDVYNHLFGKDRVLVLPFELFRKNPVDFLNRILEFSGVEPRVTSVSSDKENTAIDASLLPAKRIYNHLFVRDNLNPGALLSLRSLHQRSALLSKRIPRGISKRADRRLREKIRNLTTHDYRESNRRLNEMVPVDLTKYGYEM